MFPTPVLQHKSHRNTLVVQEPSGCFYEQEPPFGGGTTASLFGTVIPFTTNPLHQAGYLLGSMRQALPAVLNPEKLRLVEQSFWGGRYHVRYQQMNDGMPVLGAELLVIMAADHDGGTVCGETYPDIDGPLRKSAITDRDAVRIAIEDLGGRPKFRKRLLHSKVIVPTGNGPIPCHCLTIPASDPFGDWQYFISMADGSIITSANTARFHRIKSPVVCPRGYVYNDNPEDSPKRTALLKNLPTGKQERLDGRYVVVANSDGPPVVAEQSMFYFDDADTHFDEVNAYFHADRAYRYFRDLGFRGFTMNNPYGRVADTRGQIRLTVHAGEQYDNAYYLPSSGEIFFGDGSYPKNKDGLRDLAKEADVIYHEFTHAVIDELRPSIIGTDGSALHEGYADYFACTLVDPAEPTLGEFVIPGEGMIRNLKNSMTYDKAGKEPHDRGLVWGGACWSLRQKLGGEVTDFLLFGSLILLTTSVPTFSTALSKLYMADKLYFGGEYEGTIRQIFEVNRKIPMKS